MVERLQKTLQKLVETREVAGLSVLVEQGDRETCFLTEGMAGIAENTPMQRDTIYRLYSMTKPLCGAAAMILMERGELDLLTPVSAFIPSFANQQVWENGRLRPATRQVLVHDLLQMTSGLCYPDPTCEAGRQTGAVFDEATSRLYTKTPMTTQDFAAAIGRCGLDYEPGMSWRYSASADVLGAVIEVVSGMSLADFLEQEIFAPLGMKDTSFWVPNEKQPRLARTYQTLEDHSLEEYTGDYLGIQNRMHIPPTFASGGAGLNSTLTDYLQFARMLRRGGELNGARILQKHTVEHFTQGKLMPLPQATFDNDRWRLCGHTYGNLMTVCTDPNQAGMLARKGEYGWDGALGMYFSNFPVEDMTILVGMQKFGDGKWEIIRKLRNIVLSHM